MIVGPHGQSDGIDETDERFARRAAPAGHCCWCERCPSPTRDEMRSCLEHRTTHAMALVYG